MSTPYGLSTLNMEVIYFSETFVMNLPGCKALQVTGQLQAHSLLRRIKKEISNSLIIYINNYIHTKFTVLCFPRYIQLNSIN
jgi:hypothetical protein